MSERRLSVLFLISEPSPTPAASVHGDIMRFLRRDRVRVAAALPRRADDPDLVATGRSTRSLIPDHVETFRIELGPLGAGSARRRARRMSALLPAAAADLLCLARTIRRRGIEIIHCDEGTRNGFLGLLLARMTGARCVIHFHSQYGEWMSAPSRYAIDHADAILPVSRWTGRIIAERSGVPTQRILPVLNGIDLAPWDPQDVDCRAVRRELGIAPTDVLVAQVAQLAEWKRQHDLIEAVSTIIGSHPELHVAIVGAETPVPGTRPRYELRLRELIAERGLDGRVTLAGRRVDIAAVLAAADIFCLPSIGDPCALANIEAMAMGLPVVTVDQGGGPELVEHGVTGLVGSAGDTSALAEHLRSLIESPQRAHAMGRAGRARALAHLNAQRMADDVEAAYRQVLRRR